MGISVRSHLIAGFAVVAVGVIAIPPTVAAPTPTATTSAHVGYPDVRTAPRLELAASVRSVVSNPPNPQHFAAAKAAIERIDPAAASTRQSAIAAAIPSDVSALLIELAGGIDAAYQFVRYWVDNGVQVAEYVFGFIPNELLTSVQIGLIVYSNFIQPVADSVVYELLIPVLNDPLNPDSYVNGLINVGQTSVNAAINTGIAEFNLYFGWLIPLPTLPFAAKTLESAAVAAPLAAGLEATSDAPVAPPQEEQPESTTVDTEPPQTSAATDTTHQSADETTSTTAAEPPSAGDSDGIDGAGAGPSGTDQGDADEKDTPKKHPHVKAGDKRSATKGPEKGGPDTSGGKKSAARG